MAPPLLFHPLILLLVELQISTVTAAFTGKNSPLRYLGFIICLPITSLAFNNFHFYIQTTGWAGRTLAGSIFTVPLVIFDRLIIRQWAYGQDYLGPVDTKEEERKKQSRWEFGSDVAGSNRCPGTSKEVANVPHFSEEDHRYLPSKPMFLLQHFCLVIGLHYLNAFCIDIQLRSEQEYLADSFIPFVFRIADISWDEIITRVRVSIAYWGAQYCLLQLNYSVFAFLAVAFKPESEMRLWRPLFGSITLSSTVRGFWGKFWHQCMQLNVKGPADFITHTILHIPSGTVVARYLKIFLAFAVSGLMHVFADSGGVITLAESGAMSFFCTQALGIMIEDAVQEVYRRVGGKQDGWFGKVVGYLWVIAFLSWSSPVWVYPVARTMKREDMMLSVYALRPLVSYFLN